MCQSGAAAGLDVKEASAASKAIDKQIEQEKKSTERVIKLLLLGAGETGKSTILKQMKLIYGVGFTAEEKSVFRNAIILNILSSAKTLALQMEVLQIPFGFDPATAEPCQSTNESVDMLQPGDSIIMGSKMEIGSTGSELLPHSRESLAKKVTDDPIARAAAKIYQTKGDLSADYHNVAIACEHMKTFDIAFGFRANEKLSLKSIEAIKIFWADCGVKYCHSRAREYQIPESSQYFLDDIDRFFLESYQPTDQDILMARIMTTTVIETKFVVERVVFRVFDVGGQRSERRKWAPYFDDVTAILFLVAISAYDQVCFEDEHMNRLTESLNLFASICNHPVFKHTSLVLFLNKIDLFKEKLKTVPLQQYMPEYAGPDEYEATSSFISHQFLSLNKYPEKPIIVHYTWATDTKTVKKVLESVRTVLIQSTLTQLGLM
ncbi:guanine nucleotide binding protein alpha o polypeptide [Chytriomyces sp. MP71]|nr:guanine nucleotide binding protein alpha o polypeptide [Chytriomyces sp. MP71]